MRRPKVDQRSANGTTIFDIGRSGHWGIAKFDCGCSVGCAQNVFTGMFNHKCISSMSVGDRKAHSWLLVSSHISTKCPPYL